MLAFQDFTAVTTIGDLLLHAAASHGGKDALVFPDRRLSFDDLRAETPAEATATVFVTTQDAQEDGRFVR